jgi:hypothetical protein
MFPKTKNAEKTKKPKFERKPDQKLFPEYKITENIRNENLDVTQTRKRYPK